MTVDATSEATTTAQKLKGAGTGAAKGALELLVGLTALAIVGVVAAVPLANWPFDTGIDTLWNTDYLVDAQLGQTDDGQTVLVDARVAPSVDDTWTKPAEWQGRTVSMVAHDDRELAAIWSALGGMPDSAGFTAEARCTQLAANDLLVCTMNEGPVPAWVLVTPLFFVWLIAWRP